MFYLISQQQEDFSKNSHKKKKQKIEMVLTIGDYVEAVHLIILEIVQHSSPSLNNAKSK
jgi:hypothetical protein